MTWEEILAILAKADNGAAAVEALRKIHTENANALVKAKADAKKTKDESKEFNTKLTAAQERAEKVLEALGVDVDADADDLDDAISKALKDKSVDPALQKQITKLKGKLSEQETTYKTQLADERGKRFDGMKRTTLMEALAKNNADDPSLIVDMLLGKMVVSDEDESITFNDDKNSKVDDFVKDFLTAHPKLVANTQNPGAGSLLGNKGGVGDDSPDVAFVKSLAKGNEQSEGNAKALAGYFE